MSSFNKDDYMKYKEYLRLKTRKNPNFVVEDCFSMNDIDRSEILDFIDEIEKINKEITKTNQRKKKNELSRLKGAKLESLANKILETADIFTTKKNLRDHTNEIDLLLMPTDYNKSYSEFLPAYMGDDIIVECKNYKEKIKNDWIGKFFSLLTTHKVKVGIIFSYRGFKGRNEWDAAKGLAKKICLAEGVFIININLDDIRKHIIEDKKNIVELIISKYDELRHSIDFEKFISKHPAEEK